MTFIDRLNALAERIPRDAFRALGALDCVTYVLTQGGSVVYVGEGKPERVTKQFEERGKNSPAFDDFIAAHWPSFDVFLAASNITKAVALEFEGILMREFNPPFNERGPASNWASCEVGPDTFGNMRPAERLDYKFAHVPPRSNRVAEWKLHRRHEIPLHWIITRVSLRPKRNRSDTKPYEITHFNSYPPLGESVTVADHRARNETAGLNWNKIKSILHWDQLEPKIIIIEPPSIVINPGRTGG